MCFMVKKKAAEQKGHDECVREIVDELKRDHWDVARRNQRKSAGSRLTLKRGKVVWDVSVKC